ncbi:MAG: hypothetical protein MJ025_06445, partial [Victivallaceae bacterium]|nr:hypothetical protein [Victivallaceae bacterium]
TDNPNDNIVVLDSADGAMKMAVAAGPFASGADLFNFARTAMPEAERPDARAGFAEYYKRIIALAANQAAGGPVVVLGHCSVSGAKVSDDDSERGRSIGGIDVVDNSVFEGADYVALGHYHVPQDVGGSKTVRYSGSPIAMSFGEAGQRKSVTVVEFLPGREHDPEVRTIELTEYTPLRFFKGGTESVKEEVRKLRDEGPKGKIYIGVAITEGEDNLAEFWSDLEKMLEDSEIVVLKRENRRPRTEVPPIESIVESGDDITPVTVAKKVLDKNTDLSPECRQEYLEIIESIWRDVR